MKYVLTSSKVSQKISEFDTLEEAETEAKKIELNGMINIYEEDVRQNHMHYRKGIATHEEWH